MKIEVKPGSVVFEPTGEVRTVNDGEWFQAGTGALVLCTYGPTIDKCPIYRRIDAPADAKGGEQPADTIVEPSPSAPTGEAGAILSSCQLTSVVLNREERDWLNRRAEVEQELDILRTAHDADPGMQVAADRLAEEIERANRAEEQVSELESQLAQLKQQAEAWEKDHRAMEAMRRHSLSVIRGLFGSTFYQAVREGYKQDKSRSNWSDPADAILALAAQLEAGAPAASQPEGSGR